jgi:two-component system, OmpR family, sensor kinase
MSSGLCVGAVTAWGRRDAGLGVKGAAAPDDRRLLRRATVAVAVQSAVAVAVVVGVMVGGVLVVDRHEQAVRVDQATQGVWGSADDVNDPPSGSWLVSVGASGDRRATREAPGWVASVDPERLPDGRARFRVEDHDVAAWTGKRPTGRRLTAVSDIGPIEEQAERLRTAMLTAAALGVLGAALVGLLIGRRAVRPLGEALALQRRFVADASHELRTPLAVLTTRAQVLRRHVGETGLAAEVDQLVRDARVMGEVVNDLLLSAELRHEPRHGEPVQLAELVGQVVASMRPLAEERGISIVGTGPRATVLGVPSALRRAVSALADNAIAHTSPGGHVRVEVVIAAGTVALRVTDDGEGLDPQTARLVIRRFARGTSRDAGRRFGLGLALVEEVARAHGGRLDVEGSPGMGATFSLVLPWTETLVSDDSQKQA